MSPTITNVHGPFRLKRFLRLGRYTTSAAPTQLGFIFPIASANKSEPSANHLLIAAAPAVGLVLSATLYKDQQIIWRATGEGPADFQVDYVTPIEHQWTVAKRSVGKLLIDIIQLSRINGNASGTFLTVEYGRGEQTPDLILAPELSISCANCCMPTC